jgi:membrane protease YdiL (CAAX protease family)
MTSEQKVADGKLRIAIDTIVKVPTAGLMIFLAATLVIGGLRGWGISGGQILSGVRQGLIAFVIAMPVVLVVQILVQIVSKLVRQGEPPSHSLLLLLNEPAADSTLRLLIVIAAAVSAPIWEEMLFRGMLQTAFLAIFGKRRVPMPPPPAGFPVLTASGGAEYQPVVQPAEVVPARARWLSILITAAIFTAIHWNFSVTNANWEVFAPLMVLATALGYVYERTGNLWAAITLHAAFNSAQMMMWMLSH